jgi:hypothetical protein
MKKTNNEKRITKNGGSILYKYCCCLLLVACYFLLAIFVAAFSLSFNAGTKVDALVLNSSAIEVFCDLFASDPVFAHVRVTNHQAGATISILEREQIEFVAVSTINNDTVFKAPISYTDENGDFFVLTVFTVVYVPPEGGMHKTPFTFSIPADSERNEKINNFNTVLKNLNLQNYTEHGRQAVLDAARDFERNIVRQTLTSLEMTELSRVLESAIEGSVLIASEVAQIPQGLSGHVELQIDNSHLNLKRGARAVFIINTQARTNDQINHFYSTARATVDMPNASAFNFNLSVREREWTGDAWQNGQLVSLAKPAVVRIRLPDHTTSASLFLIPQGGSSLTQVENATIVNGFIVATVSDVGDFFLLAEINAPRHVAGVMIGGRFYPWSILGGTIGGVVGLIGGALAFAIILHKKRKRQEIE